MVHVHLWLSCSRDRRLNVPSERRNSLWFIYPTLNGSWERAAVWIWSTDVANQFQTLTVKIPASFPPTGIWTRDHALPLTVFYLSGTTRIKHKLWYFWFIKNARNLSALTTEPQPKVPFKSPNIWFVQCQFRFKSSILNGTCYSKCSHQFIKDLSKWGT